MASRSGRFITIEGGEGVGKSLFQANLIQALRDLLGSSRQLIATREPGGTPAADRIRALFGSPPADDPLLMETEAFLVSAARAQHVGRLIRPALQRGDWVLCDRYADSTRVYQGALGGLSPTFIETVIATSTNSLAPDLTFLLDCDVEVSLARLAARPDSSATAIKRYDEAKSTFHKRLRQAYLELLQQFPERMVRLDASQPPEKVAAQAEAEIRRRFAADLTR